MSKVTKRKHVMKEMQDDDFDAPAENQQIVRIVSARGNNLHEVESADADEKFLVTMPTKFRRNVWVKRGDFVVVEPIEEGDKVKAEIVRILTPQHIKEFTKDGIWPDKFSKSRSDDVPNGSGDESDDGFVKNTNRNHQVAEAESDSEDSETEDDSDEE